LKIFADGLNLKIMLFGIIAALICHPAWAKIEMSKPLIEAGLSGGLGYVPDYPAAEQGRMRYLAFPVFHVRGKVLRSDDEDGSRARLLNNSLIALELSASGSFPASSDQNRARAGMDDLEWLGELGPRAFVYLYNNEGTTARVSLSVRGAFSTDFKSGHYRGITFTPGFAYDQRRFFADYLTLTARLNPQWTTREMQEYFYEVPDRDVLPTRSAYQAHAGYIGTYATMALWYEPGTYGIFAGGSIAFHDGAANEASPLFKDRLGYAGFCGFRWYFFKSNALGIFVNARKSVIVAPDSCL
jgi:outer membrane protein